MTKELIEETKKAIGYTESQNTCPKCKHSEEVEDPHLDRSWHLICKVSSLCSFQVYQNGRCTVFEKK